MISMRKLAVAALAVATYKSYGALKRHVERQDQGYTGDAKKSPAL